MDSTAEIAEAFRSQGFSVELEPSIDAMPEELRQFRPDMLATRGNDHVVIEIKTREAARQDPDLAKLADAIREVPDWRLEVHFVEQESLDASTETNLSRLQTAERLAAQGELESAILVAWSGVEGALRRLARNRLDPVRGSEPSSSLLRRLYSDDVLSQRQFESLLQALEIRNRAAHGLQPSEISREQVRELVTLGRSLSDPDFRPVADLIEWFLGEFTDPVHHLPFDSREGGYQWLGTGPYDAREELAAEFEDADPADIAEAAEILEAECTEWMRHPHPDDFADLEDDEGPAPGDPF